MQSIAAIAQNMTRTAQEPSAKPKRTLHTSSISELKAAIGACTHCHGLGYVWPDIEDVNAPDFGKAQRCPVCKDVARELHHRRILENMKGEIERYTTLKGDLLAKTFKNYEQNAGNRESYTAVYTWTKTQIDKGEAKPWLYLCGATGNGKTHLAAAAANGLNSCHVPLVFATMPELLGMVSADSFREKEPLIQTLQRVPVLIIDDLGAERGGDWVREVVFRIVDARYNSKLPLLLVSNLPLKGRVGADGLGDVLGARLASRISDAQLCTAVINQAADRRIK